jgi:hypothetical protein
VLREITGLTQDDPASTRRWFHDEDFDLFVRESGEELTAFELCYGIMSNERALVWTLENGYFHDGEASQDFIGAGLKVGGPLESDPVLARFTLAAGGLPRALRLALEKRLREFAQQSAGGSARRARFRRAEWQKSAKPERARA